MKFLAILAIPLALVACEGGGRGMAPGALSPSNTLSARITPQSLTPTPLTTFACGPGPAQALTTAFDVVFAGTRRASVERATFRLVDGSTLGGPMVTFPRPDLERMFGSVTFIGQRAFRFQPTFGCGFAPRSLLGEIVILTDGGVFQTINVTAAFR